MATVFLSHSSKDAVLASRIASALRDHGHRVWLDRWKIRVGHSIPESIGRGLEASTHVAVLLSPQAVESRWVTNEWQAKYWDEVQERRLMVLPLLGKPCRVPTLLRAKRYADFTRGFVFGLIELLRSLEPSVEVSGITQYFSDIVSITDDFASLIERSDAADLLIMYGATWRNTWKAALVKMLRRRGTRLRVVLPAVDRDPALLEVYARRLGYTRTEVLTRFRMAVAEFGAIGPKDKTEIYTVQAYLNHSMYLFDTGGVLGVYSYHGRATTPALLVGEGEMLTWLKAEFDQLLSSKALAIRRLRPGRR